MGQQRYGTARIHQAVGLRAPFIEPLEARCLMSASALAAAAALTGGSFPWPQSITPAEARVAAGLGSQVNGTGAGQTIAIVAPFKDATIASDLKQFDRQFQLSDAPSFSIVNATGASNIAIADANWSAEIALDVEWAHAIAPMANVVLVQAASDHADDLAAAVDTARNLPGVSVVSMSWGVEQFAGESEFAGIFTTPPSHNGVTFVAAGSDTESATDPWPASTSTALAVETTSWPSYSLILNSFVPSATPDFTPHSVAGTGYAVYNSAGGGWQSIGGASALTPQWAGLIAIADQARAEAGLSSLDGATSALPLIFQKSGTVTSVQGDGGVTGSITDGGNGNSSQSPPADQPSSTNPAPPVKKPKPGRTRSSAPIARAAAVIYAQSRIGDIRSIAVNIGRPVTPIAIDAAPAAPKVSELSNTPKPATHAESSTLIEVKTPRRGQSSQLASINLLASVSDMLMTTVPRADSADAPMALLLATIPDPVPLLHHIGAANIHAAFADTLAVFINESANGSSQSQPFTHSHRRAWIITGSILAADAVMLRIVLGRRHKKARKEAAQFTKSENLECSQ